MQNPQLATTAMLHALAGMIGKLTPAHERAEDRGAVSIETVLWYAAAAVSVAVVAAIVWSQIKSTAGTGVNTPSAP